jgi:hypothetical protein
MLLKFCYKMLIIRALREYLGYYTGNHYNLCDFFIIIIKKITLKSQFRQFSVFHTPHTKPARSERAVPARMDFRFV